MTLALATDPTTVTRIEIADHVESAFATGAASRDDLLGAARTAGARPALLAVLGDLPDRPYAELRQLWTDLPEIPIAR
ncbi:hypothetical protein Athai_59160 [Actinocatenispora thailandica]|uniref:DUF2795 domain-containing protein n=1 Tax=Actinocatenispora thailandica TaxID=227318 RepID=A0A7R7DV42_9ACTN|nr:DUF2795 domain-containing protein [Actinocatenispora thailandica]BCJ38413.1 hypothetical protein Athai_59160 [Actinocatenispora thailandica]